MSSIIRYNMFLLLGIIFALATRCFAAEFEIFQSGYTPLKLAVSAWGGPATSSQQRQLENIIRNDLASSQSFTPMNPLSFLASAKEAWESMDYADWRIIGTDTLVLCKLDHVSSGWQAEVQVHDPFRDRLLASTTINIGQKTFRQFAHTISDFVYQTVLGIPGHFNSHILFVRKRGDFSDLYYMDQDGANMQAVGRNFTLLLSPDWSPDGRLVALNTYIQNHPRLEFFDLATGQRQTFGDFKGLNSTPEFSPDGKYIAATLSYRGSADIFLYDIKNRSWRPLVTGPAIETSPTWSPDGKEIAFVSNRSGEPQVYRISVDGGPPILVSTEGHYNTSPSWSPDGKRIAMVVKKDWDYAIATVRVDGSDIRYLSTAKGVESPSWSPNGQMLLFSAREGKFRRVYRIPSWGGRAVPITPANMDASDPAWSRQSR